MNNTQSRAGHPAVDAIFDRYFRSLLQGDRQACLAIVKDLMAREVPLKSIYLGLFERSMAQAGKLWENNTISVAVEHLATAITENAMGELHPLIFASQRCGRKAVVSCIANEYHQIGGKMVADLFEFHGWDGYFLGANTPIDGLLHLVETKKPDLVCLSLTISSNLPDLVLHCRTLQEAFPQKHLLVGGQAFQRAQKDALKGLPQVELVTSLDELEKIITFFT